MEVLLRGYGDGGGATAVLVRCHGGLHTYVHAAVF